MKLAILLVIIFFILFKTPSWYLEQPTWEANALSMESLTQNKIDQKKPLCYQYHASAIVKNINGKRFPSGEDCFPN